jgi:SAM-dependent methyltransferase
MSTLQPSERTQSIQFSQLPSCRFDGSTGPRIISPRDGKFVDLQSVGVRFMIWGEESGGGFSLVRVRGAAELTALVGLGDRIRVIEGDVTKTGLPAESVEVVVSQEAFLHVPDKAGALAEAFRLLRPGGRLAFTDWLVHRPLAPEETGTMWRGIAAQTLQSAQSYRALLDAAGFVIGSFEDLTEEWAIIRNSASPCIASFERRHFGRAFLPVMRSSTPPTASSWNS